MASGPWASPRQIRQGNGNLVLVVRFDGAQRQILVDVLRVGDGRRRDRITVGLLGVRVAFIAAEELVALKNVFFVLLRNRITEVTEVGWGLGDWLGLEF